MKLFSYVIITILIFISCSDNDENPYIHTSDFSIDLEENPLPGLVIGNIEASTNEESLNYTISSQSHENAFQVSMNTGEIQVSDPEIFDFEINPVITGVIRVSSNNLSVNVNVTITLTDIDEPHYYGDVHIRTQEDLDAFAELNYTAVKGNLTIHDDPNVNNITNMSGLLTLVQVTGVLKIENMYNILDLYGFDNLIEVGGIHIIDNWGILDVNALSSVTECSGDLIIKDNDSFEYYCGIKSLVESGGLAGEYKVSGNHFNPSKQDIIDGNCGL